VRGRKFPVTNLYRDEGCWTAPVLPICLTAYTPCFRSEAGSYGKTCAGLSPAPVSEGGTSEVRASRNIPTEELEKLTRNAETVLQKLGISLSRGRTLRLGILDRLSARRMTSRCGCRGRGCSARFRRVRFRSISGAAGEHPVPSRRQEQDRVRTHAERQCGSPWGRTWVAIVENYQQADGSVRIPEALQPYMGTDRIEVRGA